MNDDLEIRVFREKINLLNSSNLTLEQLEELSNDSSYFIRYNVAFNKKCTEDMLIRLYKEFPRTILAHPNCPDYLKIFNK